MLKIGNLIKSLKITVYGGRLSKNEYSLRLSQAQELMHKFYEKCDRKIRFSKNYLPEVGITESAEKAVEEITERAKETVMKRAEIVALRAGHEMITAGDVKIATAEVTFGKKFDKMLYFED